MLSGELLDLANKICKQKSEEQTIELKAAHVDCPKRLYDTLSSFSNQDSGGVILFGIDENADGAACSSSVHICRDKRRLHDLLGGNTGGGSF